MEKKKKKKIEEGIEIILPEIVPELFTSNEAWISPTKKKGQIIDKKGPFFCKQYKW